MCIHRIQSFQKRSEICENLYSSLVSVFTNNLLTVFLHIGRMDLWVTAVGSYCISADCQCINIGTFFIKGHIHLIGHVQLSLVFPDLFIKFSVHRSAFQDHDQPYQRFTGRETSHYRNHCPDGHSGFEIDP